MSPVFRRNLHDRLFPKHTILLFIKVEKLFSQGKFAEVCRVTLAESHQEIEPVLLGNVRSPRAPKFRRRAADDC